MKNLYEILEDILNSFLKDYLFTEKEDRLQIISDFLDNTFLGDRYFMPYKEKLDLSLIKQYKNNMKQIMLTNYILRINYLLINDGEVLEQDKKLFLDLVNGNELTTSEEEILNLVTIESTEYSNAPFMIKKTCLDLLEEDMKETLMSINPLFFLYYMTDYYSTEITETDSTIGAVSTIYDNCFNRLNHTEDIDYYNSVVEKINNDEEVDEEEAALYYDEVEEVSSDDYCDDYNEENDMELIETGEKEYFDEIKSLFLEELHAYCQLNKKDVTNVISIILGFVYENIVSASAYDDLVTVFENSSSEELVTRFKTDSTFFSYVFSPYCGSLTNYTVTKRDENKKLFEDSPETLKTLLKICPNYYNEQKKETINQTTKSFNQNLYELCLEMLIDIIYSYKIDEDEYNYRDIYNSLTNNKNHDVFKQYNIPKQHLTFFKNVMILILVNNYYLQQLREAEISVIAEVDDCFDYKNTNPSKVLKDFKDNYEVIPDLIFCFSKFYEAPYVSRQDAFNIAIRDKEFEHLTKICPFFPLTLLDEDNFIQISDEDWLVQNIDDIIEKTDIEIATDEELVTYIDEEESIIPREIYDEQVRITFLDKIDILSEEKNITTDSIIKFIYNFVYQRCVIHGSEEAKQLVEFIENTPTDTLILSFKTDTKFFTEIIELFNSHLIYYDDLTSKDTLKECLKNNGNKELIKELNLFS